VEAEVEGRVVSTFEDFEIKELLLLPLPDRSLEPTTEESEGERRTRDLEALLLLRGDDSSLRFGLLL
jgi:hypothetical protein